MSFKALAIIYGLLFIMLLGLFTWAKLLMLKDQATTNSSSEATWTLNRWDPDDATLLRSRQVFTCRQGDHVIVAGDNFVKAHDCVPRTDVTVDVRGTEFSLKSMRKP